jgi:hypothetical protein
MEDLFYKVVFFGGEDLRDEGARKSQICAPYPANGGAL